MKADTIKKVLKRRRKRMTDGVRVTLYFSQKTYEAFKKHCGEVSVSSVLDEAMQDFNDEEEKRKKRK